VLGRALNGWSFGAFEAVAKKGFGSRYAGLFRVASGSHAPFIQVLTYEGLDTFSEQEALLVNQEKAIAIRLSPFMFWTARDEHRGSTVAILDSTDQASSAFRAVEGGQKIVVREGHELEDLHIMCRTVSEEDQAIANQRCEKITVVMRE